MLKHPKARKLSDAQYLEIIVRCRNFGELQSSVARDMNVSQTTISQILNGRIYKSSRNYQYSLPFKKEEMRKVKKK